MNYQVKQQPVFPQNLLAFKEYDKAKTLAVFLFILAFVYFTIGLIPAPESHGFFAFFGNIFNRITSTISFVFHSFILGFAYCILWFTFDAKTFKIYATPVISIGFVLLYFISPLDIIPDAPLIGHVDDALIALGSTLFSNSSFLGENAKNNKLKLALDFLNRGEEKTALKLLLESHELVVKNNNK